MHTHNRISEASILTGVSCPMFIRIGLLFFGFLAFSPVVSFLFIRILGAPLVISEIPMALFFFLFRRELGLQVRFSPFIVLVGVLLVFSVGVGFLYGAYSKFAILSNARTYVVLLFWMGCLHGNRKITFEHMLYLALGSTLGWFFISLKSFSSVVFDGLSGSGATSGAMLAVSLLLSVSYCYRQWKLFWVSNILSLGTCFFSGTRRAMLSWIWAFVSSMFVEFNARKLCLSMGLMVVVSVVVVVSWEPLSDWVKVHSPYMHVRVFRKTEALLGSGLEAENDQGRFEMIQNLVTIDCLQENLIPRGMVSKWTTREEGTGIFMDCPVYELYHTFGFLGAFLLFAVVLLRVLKHLRLFWKKKQRSSAVFAILGGHMLLMMFYEGGFISFAPFSIFTAFAIVNLFSNKEVLYSARYGSQTNKQIVQVK